MTRLKLFSHTNQYYFPIFKDFFDRQGKKEEDFINKKGELSKTKTWYCSLDDFKLLVDCVEEKWQEGKKVKKKKKKR